MPSSIQISTNTTFLAVTTQNDTKEILLPLASENMGRVIRIKDVTGDTQYLGGLNIFRQSNDTIENTVSTILFSTLQRPRTAYSNQIYNLPEFAPTKPFQSLSLVSDGGSNWFIKSAYTNPLITNAPNPRDVSGLVLWFDPNIITGSNNQQISSFRNRLYTSSISAAVTFFKYSEVFQASATNLGPLLQTSGLNNQQTLLFNNSNFNMTLSPSRTYNAYTLFTMSRLVGGVNRRVWAGSNANAIYGYWNGFKNVYFQEEWIVGAVNTPVNPVNVLNSNWDLYTFTCDNNFMAQMYNLGTFLGEGMARGPFSGLTINLGAISPTEKSTCEVGEWLLYNRYLTLQERQRVEGYLAIKYGQQNRLAPGHPYSTFIPSTLSTLTNISSLVYWFDAASVNGSNNQPISSLCNLLGNQPYLGSNVFFGSNSATSTTWATLKLNTLNTLPVLEFNTSQTYTISPCNFFNEFTFFGLARQIGGTNRRIWNGVTPGINNIYGYNSGLKNIFYVSDGVEINGTASDCNWDLYTLQRQSNGMTYFARFGSNINCNYTSGRFEGLSINSGESAPATTTNCQFAEMLFFNRALNQGEVQTVESYVANKWGLASNLYVSQIGACNLYVQSAQPLASTIQVLPRVSSLKYWYNVDDIAYLTHPYKISSVINWSPSTIPGLNGWYDASGAANFTLNNLSVSTWFDRSGSNRNLTQVTGLNQPVWVSSGRYVRFDGTNDFMSFATIPAVINSSFTIFCVEKRQAAAGYWIGGTSGTTNQILYVGYQATNNSRIGFQNNDLDSTIESLDTRYSSANELTRIWSVQHSATEGIFGNRRLFLNGILFGSGTNTANLTAWVGASVGNFVNSTYYNGFIYELLFYDRYLSDFERQSVEGYLARKWNLQSNLMYFTPVSTLTNKAAIGSPLETNVATVLTGRLTFNSQLGRNVLQMNGNNSMQINTIRIYPIYTLFTVTRYTLGLQLTNYIYQGRITAALYGYNVNRKNIYIGDNSVGNIETTGVAVNSNWDIYTMVTDSNGLGRLALYSSNINFGYTQSGFEGLGINTGAFDTTASARTGCEIAEIILYNEALSSEDCIAVETYLANKYNLQSNLLAPNPNSNFFAPSTISTLSDIPNLKFWFDPTQVPELPRHPYLTQKPPLTSPSTLSSLVGWYDASGVANFTLNVSSISQWNDRSGSSNHLIQATLSNTPSFASTLVYFDGNTRFLTFTNTPNILQRNFTIFILEQRLRGNAFYMMGGTSGTTNLNLYFGYDSSTTGRLDLQGNAITFSVKPYESRFYGSNEPYRIWTVQYDLSTFTRTVWLNGFQQGQQTRFGTDLTSYVGAAIGRVITTYYNGNIREIIIYNTALSDFDRTQVEGYLAWKWNIQSNMIVATPVSTLRNLTQLGSDLVSDGSVEGSPILVSSPILQKNVLQFSITGTTQRLTTSPNRIYPSEFTMFHLSRMLGGNNTSRYIFQTNITSATMLYGYGINVVYRKHFFTNDGNVELWGPAVDSNWNLYRFQRDSNGLGGLWFYGCNINRGYIQTGFEGLGVNGGTVDNAQTSACQVGEIIIYDRCLREDECQRVEAYLATKYNLQTSMVPTNPVAPVFTPSTVSTLSHIPDLKYWYDPTQLPILTHPYQNSSVIGFSPSSIVGCEAWFDASGAENFSLVGSTIQAWADKSPRQNPLIQTTALNRPDWFSNSRNVIFNGSTRFMTFTTVPRIINTDYTIFCVEKRQAASAMYFLGGTDGTTNTNLSLGYVNSSNARFELINNGVTVQMDAFTTLDTEPYRIWSAVYGSSNSTRALYLNGILYSNQFVSADLTSWTGAGLGRLTTTYYNGRIQEFILYSRFLDTDERQSVEGYLATKWGLQSNLASFTPVSSFRNLTELGSDLRPVDAQIQNYPLLRFNSTVQRNVAAFTVTPVRRLTTTDIRIYPGAFTLFTVSRQIGGTNRYVFQGTTTSAIYGYSNARKHVFKMSGVQITDPGVVSDTQWNLHRFYADSNGSAGMFSFGYFLTSGFSDTGYEGLSLNAGSTDCNATSDFEVGEILMYDRLLSPSECHDVEVYLGNKFRIVSSLSYFAPAPSTISSISTVSSLALWFDASQIVGSNFTQVSSMINWVGTGELMSNTTGNAALFPRMVSGALNGYNILNFSTTQNLALSPTRIYPEFSLFTVARQIGGTSRRFIGGGVAQFAYGYMETGRKVYYRNITDSVDQLRSALVSDTLWDINGYIRTREGIASTITWNGTIYFPSTPLAIGGFESLTINSNDGSLPSDGQIAEMIVFSRALPQVDFQRVEGYLAWKWGLTVYLPADHPYKNTPP